MERIQRHVGRSKTRKGTIYGADEPGLKWYDHAGVAFRLSYVSCRETVPLFDFTDSRPRRRFIEDSPDSPVAC